MRKRIVIILWISLVALVIAFGSLVVYQNKMEAEKIAEEERLAQEEADRLAAEQAAASQAIQKFAYPQTE